MVNESYKFKLPFCSALEKIPKYQYTLTIIYGIYDIPGDGLVIEITMYYITHYLCNSCSRLQCVFKKMVLRMPC